MIDRFGNWAPDHPGQQPYQDQQLVQLITRQLAAQTPAPAQMMARTTIPCEIIHIETPAEVDRYQMQPGTTQIFATRAEDMFIVREQGQSGYILKRYPLAPPEPPKPDIDPRNYVTKDELDAKLAQYFGQASGSNLNGG